MVQMQVMQIDILMDPKTLNALARDRMQRREGIMRLGTDDTRAMITVRKTNNEQTNTRTTKTANEMLVLDNARQARTATRELPARREGTSTIPQEKPGAGGPGGEC
jgi:hypothetical protein